MFTRPLRMLALAATLLGCAAAQAAAPAAHPNEPLPPYETLDTDHDGIVTLPEVVVHAPHLAERLKACDRNGDHRLTREEYARCEAGASHAPAHH
ncbi:hypothetical protein [Dokdonella koreensis]|nr:hypothetical protein [Dokdonella koreensis]